MKTIGNESPYEIAETYCNFDSSVRTTIGFSDENGNIHFCAGEAMSTIVSPRSDKGFG